MNKQRETIVITIVAFIYATLAAFIAFNFFS